MTSPTPFLRTPFAAVLMVFFGFGAMVGLWAGAVPSVAAASGIGKFELGLAFAANTLLYVLAMSQGGRLGRLAGNRLWLLAGLPVLLATGALLLASHSGVWFIVAICLFGLLLGFIDVVMNAEGGAIERELGQAVFSSFHAAASAGIGAFAIVGSILTSAEGRAASLLAIAGVFALAAILVHRNLPDRQRPVAGGAPQLPEAAKPALTRIGLAVGIVIAGETAALMWSARLLDEQAPSLAAYAGTGAAFFGICTAIVRAMGDRLRARFGDPRVMVGSLLVTIAGFLGVGASTGFASTAAAFAVIGFGTACLVPCLFARAAVLSPSSPGAGIGYVSVLAGGPRILAPWLFGWIAERLSTSLAFGLCAAMLAMALLLVAAPERPTVNARAP